MSQFEIRCDGNLLNPCKDMTEGQARVNFAMYSGPQASKGHTFVLYRDGVEIDRREVPEK